MVSINSVKSYLSSFMPNNPNLPIPRKDTLVHFTGNLTPAQKAEWNVSFADDNMLKIAFIKYPNIAFTVRRQDIFTSGAQVIVNAANTHLGGGGGIDGAIHARGGNEYAKAHRELQKLYNAKYIEGHAAMIASGGLKQKYQIDSVIVVAGPQGAPTPGKETELYSCCLRSLELAEEQGKTSIALPAISTGIFGFPKDKAAEISLKAVYDFVESNPNAHLKTISIHFLPTDPKADLETYQTAATNLTTTNVPTV